MPSVSSRIWTRVTVSISYDDNHYTTGISKQSAINKKKIDSQIQAFVYLFVFFRFHLLSTGTVKRTQCQAFFLIDFNNGNYTRMLRAILNKSWRQDPTKQQLYGYLQPITKTIQVRRTTHAGHCWRSMDEFISDLILWTPSHGQAKAGRPARTYI